MKIGDVIYQLESLIEDRKSFFEKDGDDEIFRADAEALEKAIEIIQNSTMNFDRYQALAQRTSNTACSTSKLVNGVMGLNGESGECIDIVKKAEFQGHNLDTDKLIDELGDVLWYVAETCTALNVDMSEVAEKNIEKLKQRYPDGFEEERSINRNDR